MKKKFSELSARMSPAARAESDVQAAGILAELPLRELRQARELTQKQVAALLDVEQAAVSKMERQTDMYISTLRRAIMAMGGDLQIIAHFPEGDVRINQFHDTDKEVPRV